MPSRNEEPAAGQPLARLVSFKEARSGPVLLVALPYSQYTRTSSYRVSLVPEPLW